MQKNSGGSCSCSCSPSSTEPFSLSISTHLVFEVVRQQSSVQPFVQTSLHSMLTTSSIVLSYDREDDRSTRAEVIPVSTETNKLLLRLLQVYVTVPPSQQTLNVVASC
jgi:hypothetical protein